MPDNKYCVNCEYYFERCGRPTSVSVSLVTGEETTISEKHTCEWERSPVSWFARLFGDDRCGTEAKHFKQK
jgi:hypothetical protein